MPSLTYPNRELVARNYIYSLKPVLYLPLWRLPGNAFTSKDAYGHTVTSVNTVWSTRGRYFNASTAYLQCASSSYFDITEGITVFAIIIYNSAASRTILGKRSAINWNYLLRVDNNYLLFLVTTAGGSQGGADTTTPIAFGQAYFVGATYDKRNIQLYVNNKQVSTIAATSPGTMITNTQALRIGSRGYDVAELWHGYIILAGIIPYALTPKQMQVLYVLLKGRGT